MKAEYLNPFITAATTVLRQFVDDIEIERGDIEVIDQPGNPRSVATYIAISGDLEGNVLYEMNKITAVNIAEAMNEEDIPGMNELARSTIQEVANIISGNASRELASSSVGKSINITPPTMFIGSDTEISDSVGKSFLMVPLKTNYGTLIVNLSVRESD